MLVLVFSKRARIKVDICLTAWEVFKKNLYADEFLARTSLKGHCHAIWPLCKKLEGVFALTEFQNYWYSFVIKDYLKVLKPFPVTQVTGNGWWWSIAITRNLPKILRKNFSTEQIF